MTEAVLVDAVRTPFGRAGARGVLKDITHVDFVVPLMKAIVQRTKLDPNLIDEIVLGSAQLAGILTRSRMHVFEAGFPDTISATDLNKQCASSLQTIAMGAHAIMCNMSDVVLAGGVETMDRVGPIPPGGDALSADNPQVLAEFMRRENWQMYPDKQAKLLPQWFNVKAPWIMNMGQTAEKLSEVYNISREDSDKFAQASQERAVAAQDAGRFDREIIPLTIEYLDGHTVTIDKDQGPRRESTLEKLATLKGAYKEDGRVTAGNSCPRTEGATMTLLMSKDKAKQLGLKPLLTFRGAATIGTDPEIMGIGPLPATQKLLKRMGMTLDKFDLIEINEAFACQVVAVMRELGSNEWDKRLNVNGGAIAFGHPLGATGARMVGTMAYEMERRDARWGLATLCIGGGMGMSLAFEREKY
ncbi:MAG: thiolase family protein [Dehalococcoidia bacterium]|nr:thiolase family protein [Dehalococcoidia bacterium]